MKIESVLDGMRYLVNIDNMALRRPDLVSLAERFSGQWVALNPDDGTVVASGDSARVVFEAAEGDGIEMPVVLRVSDDYGQLAPWHA